jgi:hypothetical protein
MLAVTRAFGDAEFKGDANRARLLQDGVRWAIICGCYRSLGLAHRATINQVTLAL